MCSNLRENQLVLNNSFTMGRGSNCVIRHADQKVVFVENGKVVLSFVASNTTARLVPISSRFSFTPISFLACEVRCQLCVVANIIS